MKIAVLYSDARREYFPTQEQYATEAEVESRAQIVASYLGKIGHRAAIFPGNPNLAQNLQKYRPDFAINLVDSVHGQEYLAAAIPGTLELLGIPYTGSGIMGRTIDTNKFFTKNLLWQWGLTTPKYQLFKNLNDEIDLSLDFPLITKLNEIHGSVEIDNSAICHNKKELHQRLRFLMSTYHQPVLIEEFIAGREITVICLEGLNTKLYAAEKIFDPEFAGPNQIATYDLVWSENPQYQKAITYQKYDLPLHVRNQLKTAFDVLKMEDYAKFDLRLDSANRHHIIDCNHNPTLGPPETDCAISNVLTLYGINFDEILRRLITNTLTAQNLPLGTVHTTPPPLV